MLKRIWRAFLAALHRADDALTRSYLLWLLYSLGNQLDDVDAELQPLNDTAQAAAKRHRIYHGLNIRRRALIRQRATLEARLRTVRRELDALDCARASRRLDANRKLDSQAVKP